MSIAKKLLTNGDRVRLHSPYGQLIVTNGPVIRNGHQGTVIDAYKGAVLFDDIQHEIEVPLHWLTILKIEPVHEPSKQQLAIAFGKYIAGYRPGDELWSQEDETALRYVDRATLAHNKGDT